MVKRILLLLGFFFVSIHTAYATGLEYYPLMSYEFHPLFEKGSFRSPFFEEHKAYFDIKSPLFKDTAIIDFERRQITFIRYDIFTGAPVWQFHYDELDAYLNSIFDYSLYALWFKRGKSLTEEEKKPTGMPSLELVMPVHYPAWARRVIGKDPPKLSIKGFQSITVSYKKRKLETSADLNTAERRPTGGFGFDYDNMFTIRGSVGRLIDIEIKTGKEKGNEDFSLKDQMKKLKIEYKADPDSADQLEDEIIQEVVAGYTNFQMPGQGLAGYSGSHEGLFGVKVRSQWGPLALTTIMSRENAETQKTKIDPSGKTAGQVKIDETDIAREVYFFLDTIFMQKYTGKLKTAVEVTKLEVFRLEGLNMNYNKQDYAWGMYGDKDDTTKSPEATLFRRLYEKIDYEYDKKAGWIRFLGNATPGAENVITIYMVRSDSVKKGNDSLVPLQNNEYGYKLLWTLKNKFKEVVNPADLLMWRNVYYLPQDAKPEDFKIEIKRRTSDGKGEKNKNSDSLFSFILGITDKDGNPDVGNEGKFDFQRKHLILPPWKYYSDSLKDTVYSNKPFENPALGAALLGGESNLSSSMYSDTTTVPIVKYDIITTGTSKQTVFNIGWGIIPGSEKLVTKNGKDLVKDVDYLIDYEFGSITLISDRAKGSGEIDVDYQQESLFMFESKRFLGAYGKLDLPNIGRESYFATSIMGEFTTSKDKIPRVGTEPFNRMLFDANLRLDFEPEWMTSLINFIPLITTTSTSSATMDLEVAYSYLKPDKENKGEAYLDNFQSSEKGYPLGETHTLWYKASPSPEWLVGPDSTTRMLYYPPAWRSYWYSPITNSERSKREEIWKVTDEDIRNKNLYLTTLRLICQPLPNDTRLLNNVKDADTVSVNPWSGIMTPIPTTLQDRRKDRYLEFYVKNTERRGVLYVDMGEISEDISLDGGAPNKKRNYEYRNSLEGERKTKYDLGVDSLKDSSEIYLFPDVHTKSWDTLSFGDSVESKVVSDPAGDNWDRYTIDHLENKKLVNGTQGDEYLTSEDINGDGVFKVYNEENFFRVKIDFSNPPANSCYDSAKTNAVYQQNSGWMYFRIPINVPNDTGQYYKKHGNPRWDNIKFVRLLWTDIKSEAVMKSENMLEFTEMKFTGNQWEDVPFRNTGDVKLKVSVINSVDDKGYYERPYDIDSLDKEKRLMKDYALRLEYANLKHGEEAIVKRDIPSYQKIDLSLYEKIELYIKDSLYNERQKKMIFEPHIYIDSGGKVVDIKSEPWVKYHKENFVQFLFRFGNSDSSYYEFRTFSLKGYWQKDKGLRIDLQKFAAMKQAYHVKYGDRLDSINIADTLQDGSIYKIFSRTGNLPTFSNIQWMALGALRHKDAIGQAAGVIWINGLRIKGIKPLDGWAFRANLNTQWADFMDVSANVSYDDADFRQMSSEPQLVKDAKLSAGVNAQWTLSKFLPERWGVNIPFGTGVAASLSRPKQRPGTDIFLTDEKNEADGIGDMAKDFADLLLGTNLSGTKTEAEHYEKNQVTKTVYTSYSKTTPSDNPIVNLTADRITTSYSFSKDSSTELEGILPEGDRNKLERAAIGENHINVQSSRAYSSSLKYDLSPRKPAKWTSWTPFAEIKWKQFPQQMKNYELKLLPNRVNFDLLDGSFTKTYTYRSLRDVVESASVELNKENLGMTHGFQFSYSPISPLVETNFDISVNRNFDEALDKWGRWGTGRFIKEKVFALDPVWKHYLMTYAEKARNQNASIRLDPQFVDWLSHTGDYRVRYSQSPRTYKDDPNYITTKVDNEFGFSSNFRIRSLLTTLSERTEKIKGLSNIFKRAGTGLDKIDLTAFNFTYNATSNLNNDYVSTGFLYDKNMGLYDFFKYQLGIKGKNLRDIITGNMDDEAAFGGMRYRYDYDEELYRNDRRAVNQNYTITTSLALPKPIDISIRPISLGWTRGYSVLPNPMIMDSTKTFPELQLGANSNILEKLPIVKKNLQNLGMQSTYRLSKTVKKTYSNPNDTSIIRSDITRKHAWDPLISFDGLLKKWPVNIDYAYRFSFDTSVSMNGKERVDNSGTKNKSYGNTWNVKYTIQGKPDRQINLLNRWTFPIKGETVMSFDVIHTANKRTFESREEQGKKDEESDWALTLHPKITYDFTDNIDGLLEYIFEKSYNSFNEEKRTNNALLFTVTIHFN